LPQNSVYAVAQTPDGYLWLPPGKCTFRVIAANSDNVWNKQGAAIEIVVLSNRLVYRFDDFKFNGNRVRAL